MIRYLQLSQQQLPLDCSAPSPQQHDTLDLMSRPAAVRQHRECEQCTTCRSPTAPAAQQQPTADNTQSAPEHGAPAQHLIKNNPTQPAGCRFAGWYSAVPALQLRLFYGPLLASVTATKSAYEAMAKQHSPDGTMAGFQQAIMDRPSGPEATAYRWVGG